MANEITLTASLSCFKPTAMSSAIGRSWTDLLSTMNGNVWSEGSMTVSLAGTAIYLGQVSQPNYATFYSNPNVNSFTSPPTTITGAANNGSGLIRITDTAHGYVTGDYVTIAAVGGTAEAIGSWPITVITANTFDLIGSAFVNAYTSGGTAQLNNSIRIADTSGGLGTVQIFTGYAAIFPLRAGCAPYAFSNPAGQILEYLIIGH